MPESSLVDSGSLRRRLFPTTRTPHAQTSEDRDDHEHRGNGGDARPPAMAPPKTRRGWRPAPMRPTTRLAVCGSEGPLTTDQNAETIVAPTDAVWM